MEYKIIQLEHSICNIEITYTNQELAAKYEEGYKKTQPHIDMQGFRKGKVPLNVVKKMFGKKIQEDVNEELINDFLKDELQKTDVRLVAPPILKSSSDNLDLSKTFVLECEVFPAVVLKDYKSLKINEPVHSVVDKDIDSYITVMLYEKGEKSEVEEITDNIHTIECTYSKLDESGNQSAPPKNISVFLWHEKFESLRADFIGKKVGDTFTVVIPKKDKLSENVDVEIENEELTPVEEVTEVKTEENIETTQSKSKDFTVEFTINKITKHLPLEFNEDFVKENSKFETIEDYKEEIGFMIQEFYDKKSISAMKDQIIQQLVQLHIDTQLPKSLLEMAGRQKAKDIVAQYKMPENFADQVFENTKDQMLMLARQELLIEIILDEIIEKEEIKVEDYDVEPHIQNEIKNGIKLSEQEIKERLLENENFVLYIKRNKVMDLLLDFAEATEVPFTLADDLFADDEIEDADFDEEEFEGEEFDDEFDDDDYDEDEDDDDDFDDDDDDDDDEDDEDEDDDEDDEDDDYDEDDK